MKVQVIIWKKINEVRHKDYFCEIEKYGINYDRDSNGIERNDRKMQKTDWMMRRHHPIGCF